MNNPAPGDTRPRWDIPALTCSYDVWLPTVHTSVSIQWDTGRLTACETTQIKVCTHAPERRNLLVSAESHVGPYKNSQTTRVYLKAPITCCIAGWSSWTHVGTASLRQHGGQAAEAANSHSCVREDAKRKAGQLRLLLFIKCTGDALCAKCSYPDDLTS